MLSNLMSQLKEQQMLHKLEDVLKEIPYVRKDFGYPPLVTPLSQIVGVQATLNVITNIRYKLTPKEVKDYLSGKYGKPPVEIDDLFYERLLGDTPKITCRPADLIPNELDELRLRYPDITDIDLLTIALFDHLGIKHVEAKRKHQEIPLDRVEGKHTLKFKLFAEDGHRDKHMIKAPITGSIQEILVSVHTRVKKEDTLLIMHNSKLHVEILAPIDGVITSIDVEKDQDVDIGTFMISIK
jgi:pyruvate carboxylase